MNVLNILVVSSVIIFIIISLVVLAKRYKENKEKLDRISSENTLELKKSLEEEVRQKREEELKRLEAGDKATITEVLDRLFKSSRLAGWVKSKTFNLHNSKSISIIVYVSGREELVNTQKEITLKTGEVYKQNKHYLAVKKEYSEKVFQCAYKILEEAFTNIPTLYKIYISEYISITDDEKDNPVCVLSMEANKDQFRSVMDKNSNNPLERISMFNAKYNYDGKNYDFQEVDPVETPAGETSLEKTMATKASANTSFYGSTIVDPASGPISMKKEAIQPDNTNLGSETKIANLSGGSIHLDKSALNLEELFFPVEKPPEEDFEIVMNKTMNVTDNFDVLVQTFMTQKEFKIISEEATDNDEVSILAIGPTKETYIINISKSVTNTREENLKALVSKIISKNVMHGIYITNGAFGLDSVQYAAINSIELYDKEKLSKTVNGS
jgi:hypothetical protein